MEVFGKVQAFLYTVDNRIKTTDDIISEKYSQLEDTERLELPLPERFKIDSILEVVELSEQGARCSAALSPIDKLSGSILLNKPIIVPGKILLEKQSVLMWATAK